MPPIDLPPTARLEHGPLGKVVRGRAREILSFCFVFGAVLILLEAAFSLAGGAVHALRAMPYLPAFFIQCAVLYIHILLLGGALIGVERFMPGSGAPKRYGKAALFWACYVPVAVVSADLAHGLVRQLHIEPLLALNFNALQTTGFKGVVANAGLILLSAVLFDFFYYWFHRLQHTVPFLWAFHSVHHSNRSLNAIGCYHHPLEDLLRIPLFLLPMAVAFEVIAPPLVLVSAFVTGWGLFNHMDSRFSLGSLRRVLADNHYHRVHHSLAREHYDVNFAGMFSPWDKLFGTQVIPPAGAERLTVGLEDMPHPQTLRQYLSAPFVLLRRRRSAK